MKIINIEEITNELLLALIISLCKLCEFTSVVFWVLSFPVSY